MNQFAFNSGEKNAELYAEVQHLQDAATDMGLDCPLAFCMTQDTELEQLQQYRDDLQQQIKAELAAAERAKRPRVICHIGPYALGICTICGKAQP